MDGQTKNKHKQLVTSLQYKAVNILENMSDKHQELRKSER